MTTQQVWGRVAAEPRFLNPENALYYHMSHLKIGFCLALELCFKFLPERALTC